MQVGTLASVVVGIVMPMPMMMIAKSTMDMSRFTTGPPSMTVSFFGTESL